MIRLKLLIVLHTRDGIVELKKKKKKKLSTAALKGIGELTNHKKSEDLAHSIIPFLRHWDSDLRYRGGVGRKFASSLTLLSKLALCKNCLMIFAGKKKKKN